MEVCILLDVRGLIAGHCALDIDEHARSLAVIDVVVQTRPITTWACETLLESSTFSGRRVELDAHAEVNAAETDENAQVVAGCEGFSVASTATI